MIVVAIAVLTCTQILLLLLLKALNRLDQRTDEIFEHLVEKDRRETKVFYDGSLNSGPFHHWQENWIWHE